jgi:hypothetical protein
MTRYKVTFQSGAIYHVEADNPDQAKKQAAQQSRLDSLGFGLFNDLTERDVDTVEETPA